MIITITNPRNKMYVQFLDNREYKKRFGKMMTDKKRQEIAINERCYELYSRGFGSGIFALPQNTTYNQKGFNQDGTDFRMNTYEQRTIIFEFKQFFGYTSTQQAQVFYQIDHMLQIAITTDKNTYYTNGSLIGDYSTGVIELECPNPLFYIDEVFKQEENILISPSQITLLPLRLPQEFFGANQEQGSITFDATFPTDFYINMEGSFDEITIKCITAGANIHYKGTVKNQMSISTYDETVVVDDVDVTEDIIGTFPTLFEGKNRFEFVIPNLMQKTDVKITLSYRVVVANVE